MSEIPADLVGIPETRDHRPDRRRCAGRPGLAAATPSRAWRGSRSSPERRSPHPGLAEAGAARGPAVPATNRLRDPGPRLRRRGIDGVYAASV